MFQYALILYPVEWHDIQWSVETMLFGGGPQCQASLGGTQPEQACPGACIRHAKGYILEEG